MISKANIYIVDVVAKSCVLRDTFEIKFEWKFFEQIKNTRDKSDSIYNVNIAWFSPNGNMVT